MPDLWLDVDAALSEVPVNILPLLDDTDFKSREVGITYDQAGMDLVWNFVTTAGAMTQTAVTPTTAGDYDWAHQGDGMYSIEIPASGGVSINNDTEGFGWFTGFCTGVLPWRGPTIGFRAAGLNNALIDSAYSATRGLAGTALPDAAADAAGGLPISDLGGLDLDTQIGTDIDAILADTNELQTDDLPTLIADLPTVAEFEARTILAADYFDPVNDAVANVTLVATTTTNSDMRGTDSAALASVCTEARLAELDAGNIPTDLTNIAAAVDLNTLIISPVGGTTDSNGSVGGTTVLDSTRTEPTDHWNNLAIEITSGVCIGQLRPIELYTNGVGFTVPSSRPFTAQIVSGVTYRIVSAVIAQPGITVSKNAQTVVEPDGLVNIGLTIITANGAPPVGDITPGTISIYRIRAGASTLIVNAAAMSEAEGNAFYSYTFPSASWQAGDSYLAVTIGQSVIVNGTNYPLSTTAMQGYVTREIAILADTDELQTDDIPTLIADLPTVAEFEARTIPTADYFDPVNDAVANVTLVATTTTNTDMRGTDGANTTVPDAAGTAAALHVTTDAAIAALNDPTAAAVADAVWDELSTGHTDAGKAGQQLWTDVDAILADTNELQTDDVPGLIAALNDISVTDITQRQIPDSVPADGVLPTIEQALYMITQFLMERAVSGTTVTVKKVDGSTSLLTLTLDDASDPTSITRAT